MFKRRTPKSLIARLRDTIWPTLGWRRFSGYVLRRLARLPGTSYALAAGFACGAAASFTPLIGFHFLLAGLLAWLMRANILASAIGTVVGNPWTFPFIWAWLYASGTWILQGGEAADPERINFAVVLGRSLGAMVALDIAYLADRAWPVLAPMLLSSVPTGAVAWVAAFLMLRPLIARYKMRRIRRAVAHGTKAQV